MIDEVEINEFESQMVNLADVYMNDGMALELEELIGNNIKELERVSFNLDTNGQNKVTPHPLTTITTLEILEKMKKLFFFEISSNLSPVLFGLNWLMITVDTGMFASLTGASVNGEESMKFLTEEHPSAKLSNFCQDFLPRATFTFEACQLEIFLTHH